MDLVGRRLVVPLRIAAVAPRVARGVCRAIRRLGACLLFGKGDRLLVSLSVKFLRIPSEVLKGLGLKLGLMCHFVVDLSWGCWRSRGWLSWGNTQLETKKYTRSWLPG